MDGWWGDCGLVMRQMWRGGEECMEGGKGSDGGWGGGGGGAAAGQYHRKMIKVLHIRKTFCTFARRFAQQSATLKE